MKQKERKYISIDVILIHPSFILTEFLELYSRLTCKRNNLLWMENRTWAWNETIFIQLLAFPLSVIHHFKLETVRATVQMMGRWMTRRFEEESEAFSNRWVCTVNYALYHCQWHVIITVLSKRRRLSPCVPAPGRWNTSLQHLWSPAHNSGSVCLEVGEPEPRPRLRCSSLSLHTPAAVNKREMYSL